MSTNLVAYVERQKNGQWESIVPYVNSAPVWFWPPNATYQLFDILKHGGHALNKSDIESLSHYVSTEYSHDFDDNSGCYGARVWNLADMMIQMKDEMWVHDDESEDENDMIITPLKELVDKVKFYYEDLAEEWFDCEYSKCRLVYWFC